MPDRTKKELNEVATWKDKTIQNFLGGMVLDQDSELLEDSETLALTNLVMRNKKLQRDTGYSTYLGAVRGDPRRYHRHVTVTGTVHELLITNDTVYRKVNDQWRYVSDGTSTTLSGNEAAGQTALSVSSIAGFADNDYIGIVLDTGQMHFSQVNGAPAAGVITIDDALPSLASSGNAVIKAVALTGTNSKHVTALSVPWNDWVIFTNGYDVTKRFDPTANTVINIPNLPGAGTLICQTLELFDSSIILANCTVSGTSYPFRYYYCAKGDGTNWTTLEAGYADLLDTTSAILQALKLGPDLILYRENAIVKVAISSGLARRFDNDTMVSGVGIFSQHGVADLIDRHFVWANDDFYWYKGGFSVEPVTQDVKSGIFFPTGDLDEAYRTSAFVLNISQYAELLCVYQPTGQAGPNKAYRYSLFHDAWTVRNFANTISGFGYVTSGSALDWDDLTGDWIDQVSDWASYSSTSNTKKPALCLSDDNIVAIYDFVTANDAGDAINVVFETKDFAEPSWLIRHDYVDFGFRGGTITVEYSTDKGQSWVSLGTANADATTQRFRFYKQFVSRHFRYRVTTSSNVNIIFTHIHFMLEYDW